MTIHHCFVYQQSSGGATAIMCSVVVFWFIVVSFVDIVFIIIVVVVVWIFSHKLALGAKLRAGVLHVGASFYLAKVVWYAWNMSFLV